MKKLALTFAIVLGMTIGAFAQEGGLFGKGPSRADNGYSYREGEGSLLGLPSEHNQNTDQGAPLGSGLLLLAGFGAAYALKKHKED